jgi:hypothetical protein
VAVGVEPPVLAVVDLPVLARRAHRVQLPLRARLPVLAKAHLPVPAEPLVLARVPVVEHLVVEPEVLRHRRSRQSFSAARARSSP